MLSDLETNISPIRNQFLRNMNMTQKYFIQLGIAVRIPMAVERFCDKNLYDLDEIAPENYAELTKEEKKISFTYSIMDKSDKKLASFSPSGEFECFDFNFRPIFDRIIEDLHYAAYKAKQAQDRLHKQMTEELEYNLKNKNRKSGF
jgi:hypothetical protein